MNERDEDESAISFFQAVKIFDDFYDESSIFLLDIFMYMMSIKCLINKDGMNDKQWNKASDCIIG